MILNKISGIRELLQDMRGKDATNAASPGLGYILKNIEDLINWVKFIQVAHDLREVIAASGQAERRNERRFRIPEIFRGFLQLRIMSEGAEIEGDLLEFSNRGLKFRSPARFETGTSAQCTLLCGRAISKEISFRITIRYCIHSEGEFVIGANVEHVADGDSLDLFKELHEFLSEIAGSG